MKKKELTEEEILPKALIIANKKIEEMNKVIDEQKPAVEFYNNVAHDKEFYMDMSDFAKLVSNGIGQSIGSHTLFVLFRDMGIMCKGKTIPKQEYIDKGWFKVIQVYKGKRVFLKTLITNKGEAPLLNKITDFVRTMEE